MLELNELLRVKLLLSLLCENSELDIRLDNIQRYECAALHWPGLGKRSDNAAPDLRVLLCALSTAYGTEYVHEHTHTHISRRPRVGGIGVMGRCTKRDSNMLLFQRYEHVHK